MTALKLDVRDGKESDFGFVLHQWSKENSKTQFARDCGRVYFGEQKDLVLRLLKSYSTVLKVLVLDDDEDAVMGFVVYSLPTDQDPFVCLHYAYVRPEIRRQGYARRLCAGLGDKPLEFSHKPAVHGLRVPASWVYNPYRAFRA